MAQRVTRSELTTARRVVIKVGSSSLTSADGSLNSAQLHSIVEVVAQARARGQEILLVSSGAVAAGIAPLGFKKRPHGLRDQQAAAMVGQSLLMAAYSDEFAAHGLTVGQVLLTPNQVINRRYYANAQASLTQLLSLGVVPIINENDAVVTDALRFGDNDRVAALVSHLVRADALILCTDVDGLYTAPPNRPGAKLISQVDSIAELERYDITGKGSDVGTGGMRTKISAAQIATAGGVGVLLTDTRSLNQCFGDGATRQTKIGTWFAPRSTHKSARQLWLSYAAQPHGSIVVDDGAARALRAGGRSLLAVGAVDVHGSFAAGDLVSVTTTEGEEVVRGISAFSNGEIRRFLPTLTDGADPRSAPRPLVHADDMVTNEDFALS